MRPPATDFECWGQILNHEAMLFTIMLTMRNMGRVNSSIARRRASRSHMLSSPANMPAPLASGRVSLSLAALILGGIAIGFSPIFVRLAHTGPITAAFWRVALAAPVLWLWALASSSGPSANPLQRARALGLLIVGLSFVGDLSFWHWSIKLTSVANATLLANLSAVVVTLAAWLLYRQRPRLTFSVGLVLALAGTALLMWRSFGVGVGRPLGDLFGVVTALCYSVYLLTIKRLRDAGCGTATIACWGTTITALGLLPIALISGESMIPPDARAWAVLFALALVSHAGGQTLIAYALAQLPAAFSSVALLIEPLVAAIIAWPLFGERLGPIEVTGGALILAGIYVSRRGSNG
jgi:drug/metabolite transporter (DMT)-like permease